MASVHITRRYESCPFSLANAPLDFDEPNGVAVEADAQTLVETLERSRFTFLN